jgi:ABC-2 type transport system ATP-binding protein
MRGQTIGSGQGSLVVEAAGLSKVFTDFWMRTTAKAVDSIDFEIRPREIFGLLGPNGSGKSTTIKMILGLLRKTRGKLSVFGRDPGDVAVKARIGYLPEESYMYKFLDPTETLDYYGKLFGLARAERRRRADELLEMVGLTGAAHRPVGEFSKGMARRLGLAQALINDPEFLILDEPTSGLDPIGTRQVKDLLLELGRRGKTILLSSHLLADVEDVCDRMVILYGGRIRAAGTTDELLADTSHSVIRTPRLRAETIAHIDALLQREEGVAIESVAAPHQRLEDLFMEIVERARQEQAATSGALHGGRTAAFLAAGSEERPTDLIAQLERGEASERMAREVSDAAGKQAASAASDSGAEVLKELLERPAASSPATRPSPEPAKPPATVDRGVIDGLLGDADRGQGNPPGGGR